MEEFNRLKKTAAERIERRAANDSQGDWPSMDTITTPDGQRNNLTQTRLQLREAGYSPIPVCGKIPKVPGWNEKHHVDIAEIEGWPNRYSDHTNTGLLTQRMPTFDIDILDDAAAAAIEEIACCWFAGQGHVLVRIGKAPKRAIIFQTDEPFAKMKVSLRGPNGDAQGLEFLCDGQQMVCDGIHPDTKQPYAWKNGHPPDVKRNELVSITKATAQELLDTAVNLLCTRYGYTRASEEKPKTTNVNDDNSCEDDPNLGLNSLALANLSVWVPELFPSAQRWKDGYRISSASLGRDLEEDISCMPNGIKDFGVWDIGDENEGRRTSVALVMEWKTEGDESAAIRWLCERLNIPIDDGPAFSEQALAIKFAERHASGLRYVARFGQWFLWNGACWREDEKRGVFTMANKVCREVAITCNKTAERKRIASAKTRAAVVSLASEDPRIAATADQFDANPWLLSTPNGVVDLRTGAMRAARPEDYMTKSATVSPGGDCPKWKKFLKEITSENEELQLYLQRVGGYCLTGVTTEQELYFLYGAGRNGKSVFVKVIATILGDYHRSSSIETFTVSQSDRHPTEIAGLRGARLVTATETEDGRRWSEARIKELTGGDKISARFMHQNFFDFTPQFKLMFAGNHMPTLRTVNMAISRRFRRVPFTVTIAVDKVNTKLADELMGEAPGILAWFIEGCLAWQRDGLKPPKVVTEATDAYLESQDVLGNWLAERCDVAASYSETSAELHASWRHWTEERGEFAISRKEFGQKLEDRGFKPKKIREVRSFIGLRVKEECKEMKTKTHRRTADEVHDDMKTGLNWRGR
jgi:putative DNA primase/helicase